MSSIIVSTDNGQIKGRTVRAGDNTETPVHVFRNIPFAKPPLGKFRFLPPQPADAWDEIRDCTVGGNLPMYDGILDKLMMKYWLFMDPGESKHSEDCLYLSVYTPALAKDKKLPVMFWIYGGGFQFGSESFYDGTTLAGMNDVVVVVPNYRVGVFGFLSLGPSSRCQGNAGILDQQMALKWVQNNIGNFGGDKDNVTIFGESAGGIAVDLLFLSPLSHGFFHKAISHSGQALTECLLFNESKCAAKSKEILSHLKIDESSTDKVLEALQNVPAQKLVEAAMKMKTFSFVPSVDGIVIPKHPEKFMKDMDFPKLPYIIGCNNSEGDGLMPGLYNLNFHKSVTADEARKAINFTMTDEGYEKCKQFYIKDWNDEMKFNRLYSNIVADSFFIAPAVQTACSYSAGGVPVYMYHGAFRLKMFHDLEYGAEVEKKVDWCDCDHGDEIYMVFGVPFRSNPLPQGAKFTEEEKELSRKFMTYLTNFAKSGNPNEGKSVATTWPRYEVKRKHLIVDSQFSIGENLHEKQVKFWMNDMRPHIVNE